MTQKAYKIQCLADFPALVPKVTGLIEQSFGYQAPHKLEIDFYPLMQKENLGHRYVLLDEETQNPVGHIGIKLRSFAHKARIITVCMLGGIAVDENVRGQGLFTKLFDYVLDKYSRQSHLLLLWSDKHDLYARWGFHLCGSQWSFHSKQNSENFFECCTLQQLNNQDLNSIKSLYRSKIANRFFSPMRTEKDWQDLSQITSANWYVQRSDENITGYFVQNKGADLQGIIHEWATVGQEDLFVARMATQGTIWGTENIPTLPDEVLVHLQSIGLFRIGARERVVEWLQDWSISSKYDLGRWQLKKDGVSYQLNEAELLEELFGPAKYGLLQPMPKVFISGLDSI